MIRKLIHKMRKRRFCKLNRWSCSDCICHDFVFEGAIFRGNKCRYPKYREKERGMSGGSLGYFYCTLGDHVGDFGDKELDELVKDLAELFHDREWYLSADTGIGSWNEARDEFKKKWFTELGRTERIERYLEELSDEVRKSYGISKKYCKNCKYWAKRDDNIYGDCTFHEHCLMHRSESCHRFAESEVE